MTNQELEKFLLENGFVGIGGDDDGEMYNHPHMSFWIGTKENDNRISYSHADDGYYEIGNPSIETIKTVISIFKSEYYVSAEKSPEKMRREYGYRIFKMFEEYLKSKEKFDLFG